MNTDLIIESPEGMRVDVRAGDLVIRTDQSVADGGEGSAPEPFLLFLAAIGSCAGHYVFSFCRSRGIPTEGIRLIQRHHYNQELRRIDRIELDIELNEGFPEKYRKAVVRSANLCAVKRHIIDAPEFIISAVPVEER